MKTILILFTIIIVSACNNNYELNCFETKATGLDVYTGDSIEATWKYTIINKTKKDYYLPKDEGVLYCKMNSDNGLIEDTNVKWETGKYLPPRETIGVQFSSFYNYNDNFKFEDKDDVDKLSKFMAKKIGERNMFA